jgi:hypothetical protein
MKDYYGDLLKEQPYGGKPPFQDTSDTSEAAAGAIAGGAGTLRLKVFEAIKKSSSGLTNDEIEVQLVMRIQTVSARVRELVLTGWLIDSGRRRPTRSGRMAVVWLDKERRPLALQDKLGV